MHNRDFLQANKVFIGVFENLRQEEFDKTKHKLAIAQGDMNKMYSWNPQTTPHVYKENSLLNLAFILDEGVGKGYKGQRRAA